ncbi:MAG TPA: aminomethyl-transferring glycine dehydrogenase subunit GcvPB, partial [Candidatus Omnitrophota bacterium]|nr:aminomethyl-transferring glycine dehydrogenase subunit GcvPB [Candidatus Omnitrophota bacterium]
MRKNALEGKDVELIFEKSVKDRRGFRNPKSDVPVKAELPSKYKRGKDSSLPQVSELDFIRHFTKLSHRNFSVDTNFYPLGSCTMKYNPRFTESVSRLSGFADLHPLLAQLPNGEKTTQGALKVLFDLEQTLC